jgi:hypothetical protein
MAAVPPRNFLYVALKSLLDLEKEISFFAASNGISGLLLSLTLSVFTG